VELGIADTDYPNVAKTQRLRRLTEQDPCRVKKMKRKKEKKSKKKTSQKL